MTPPIDLSFQGEIKDSQQAESIVSKLNKKEKKLLLDALQKGDESKPESKDPDPVREKSEKLPELADKNFKVENTKGRKEVTDPNGVKVLENPEGDVREYLEGDYKGEQLFTQDSALREVDKAGKRLPPSWTTYRDIINKKYEGNYQDFLKGENMFFPGWRVPINKTFTNIDGVFYLRCADGSYFYGYRALWTHDRGHSHCGFSVRCLQD